MIELWSSIENIQSVLDLDDVTLADYMEITQREFSSLRRERRSPCSTSAMKLARRLNLHFDGLMTNQFDEHTLFNSFYGKKFHLPEKYSLQASMDIWSVSSSMNFIGKVYGAQARFCALRKFQLTPQLLNDPHQKVNISLLMDLIRYIRLSGSGQSGNLLALGVSTIEDSLDHELFSELRGHTHYRDVYTHLFEDLMARKIEKTNFYKILKIDKEHCHLDVLLREETKSMIGKRYFESSDLCYLRMGRIIATPRVAHLSPAKIKKLSCISQGDASCRYELSYNDAG